MSKINTDRVFETLYMTLITESGWDFTACVEWLDENLGQYPDGFVDYVSTYYPEKVEQWND